MRKNKITQADFKKGEDELLGMVREAAKDRKHLLELLEDILTPREYRDLVIRWILVKELVKGTPQREIAWKLGISFSRITRGSRALEKPAKGFDRALRRLGYIK